MENKKEYYENLYNRYKELLKITKFVVDGVSPVGGCKIQRVGTNKDREEKNRLRKKMHNCLRFLSNEQLREKELYDDPEFSEIVVKIIQERKNREEVSK